MRTLSPPENYSRTSCTLAKILPFKGYLPPPSLAKVVSSPPYDVLSSDEAREMVKKNDRSFLRVVKPEVDFTIKDEPQHEDLHQHAANNLDQYISAGNLLKDEDESFYVYQISMGMHMQTGIIAAVSIEEYDGSLIKRHEFTRPEKEDDRTMHIDITGANTGPVFLTFRNNGGFKHQLSDIISREKDISFKAEDDTVHSIWKVKDAALINGIRSYFKTLDCLYIADGHHRAASASRIQKTRSNNNPYHNGNESYNYFLATIFPHDQVQILAYNRLVKDLGGLSEEQFLNAIESKFQVKNLSKREVPNKKLNFTMYFIDQWYALEVKPEIISDDSALALDAAILQEHILGPILKITDPRTDNRIDFVGGSRGLEELEHRCKSNAKVAFALYPVSIDDLLRVSDDDKVMPPKSTWFEPKLRSGLVVRLLD